MTVFVLKKTNMLGGNDSIEIFDTKEKAMRELENKVDYQMIMNKNLEHNVYELGDCVELIDVEEDYLCIRYRILECTVQ